MWLKRYVIVVPTLGSPFMPVRRPAGVRLTYTPTWVEWSITAAAFAGFCLLYLLFSKVFPIVSIWEIEDVHEPKTSTHVKDAETALPVPTGREVLA